MTEELKKKVEKIIGYCGTQAEIYNNYQLSCKICINGIYGAFGFSGFYFYNPTIAESVAKQGKNGIKYAEKLIDAYFQRKWINDDETHKMMGVTIKTGSKINNTVCVYQDTDSVEKNTKINLHKYVIEIYTDTDTLTFNPEDRVKVLRDGAELEIFASDIRDTDKIDI